MDPDGFDWVKNGWEYGSYQVIVWPKTAFLRTYHDPVDPDSFDQVKNGWESLEGTRTEQLDPILSLLGPHTRSQGSYQVVFGPKLAFLRTYCDPVDTDGFDQVKNGWESLEGTGTEQLDPILSKLDCSAFFCITNHVKYKKMCCYLK